MNKVLGGKEVRPSVHYALSYTDPATWLSYSRLHSILE